MTPSDALQAKRRFRVQLIRRPFPVRLARCRAWEGLSSSLINPVHIPRPLRREVLGHCASKLLVPSIGLRPVCLGSAPPWSGFPGDSDDAAGFA